MTIWYRTESLQTYLSRTHVFFASGLTNRCTLTDHERCFSSFSNGSACAIMYSHVRQRVHRDITINLHRKFGTGLNLARADLSKNEHLISGVPWSPKWWTSQSTGKVSHRWRWLYIGHLNFSSTENRSVTIGRRAIQEKWLEWRGLLFEVQHLSVSFNYRLSISRVALSDEALHYCCSFNPRLALICHQTAWVFTFPAQQR